MKKILLIFLPFILFAASVNVKVNKKIINEGEELIITISAQGKNIKFPQISKIDGQNIIGTSTSDNISVINGSMTEITAHSYAIYPQKSINIPSFTVYINNKPFKTKPVFIQVTKPKQTKGDFELDINISKNNLYLGENAVLNIKFIQKENASSIQIQKPNFKNFIFKKISSNQKIKKGKQILTYKFLIIPQKTGTYEIGPLIARIGKIVNSPQSNNFFGLSMASMKYTDIYSNTLKLKISPIPTNSIYGDFNISLNAKNRIKADKPNKITLQIKGCGDFYSMGNFSLNIPNVTIYPSNSKKDLKIINNKLCGTFTKNFTIIAEHNYTIPSIYIKEFNGKIHTIKTIPVDVNVTNFGNTYIKPVNQIQPKIIKKTIVKNNYKIIALTALIFLTAGIILGVLLYFLYNRFNDFEIKSIKKADKKGLLNILKKYEDNPKIKEIIQQIEENIYNNTNNKIDKKEIIKIIKKLKKK